MLLNHGNLLSITIWLPLLGALLLWFIPGITKSVAKAFAVGISAGSLALTVLIASRFQAGTYHFQFGERINWMPSLGIRYEVGIDGISVWMLVLTSLLGLIGIIISKDSVAKPRSYFALLLMLQTTMLGVFSALDLVLFYTFFELSLIPVALLILQWGGPDRKKVSIKYLAALFAGSILMLIGIIQLAYLHQQATGTISFSLIDIQNQVASGMLWRDKIMTQSLVFWAFALAFLVKSPGVPFHTWLTDTYAQSPIAVIVAGVVLKVGTYGMFRFLLPLFPDVIGSNVVWLMLIGVVGIIYGGILAAGQTNGHRLLAFSTVSHVGFILVGLFSLNHTGLSGAAFQQLNHGLTAAALFVLLHFLYQRREDQSLEAFGGLKRQMPVFATFFLIAMLANVGLPFTSGFVGEFLALMGAFEASYTRSFGLNTGFAVVAGFGVVLSAAYLLYMFQKLFYGKPDAAKVSGFKDLGPTEIMVAGVFAVLMIGLGIAPSPIQKSMETSVHAARMMATSLPGERPTWLELNDEVTSSGEGQQGGALVRLQMRMPDQVGAPVYKGVVRTPANLHPTFQNPAPKAEEEGAQ